MGRKSMTKEEFIRRSIIKHNNKYLYDKLIFTSLQEKGSIICPIHGDFLQILAAHLAGRGCKLCQFDNMKSNTDKFVISAIKIHNNKYNYSKVKYISSQSKVIIICPIHGEFLQTPTGHLSSGCWHCGGSFPYDTETFIEKSKKIHGDRYDYSEVDYINSMSKVKIICKEHGEWFQKASHHLSGHGCKHCNIVGRFSEKYFKNKPEMKKHLAKLYLIKINDGTQEFYKIGITTKKLDKRFEMMLKQNYSYTILFVFNSELYPIFYLEQKLLRTIINNFDKPKNIFIKGGGETECFLCNINDIENIIKQIKNSYEFKNFNLD